MSHEPPPSAIKDWAHLGKVTRMPHQWITWIFNLSERVKELENVINGALTAFGSTEVAQLTPVINVQFPYSINSEIVETRNNGGTTTVVANLANVSTGAGANQSAQAFSITPIKYYAGVGGLVRFTALFTTGVANSTQLVGLGDSGDGYFFGYDGADFGILRRKGGNPEIRALQITTKSTTAENITITLDGDADATVAVTDATAGDVTTTANDIAAHDFSGLGRGWSATAEGDTVNFKAFDSSSRTGTYTLSGATTAVGSSSQALAGIAPTDNWTAQTAWNVDKFTELDQTKGNVFQIRYQWLGFGQIDYFVERQSSGAFVLCHSERYANVNTTPSVDNPTLPLCMMAENTSNTSDIVIKSGSMAGFIEGLRPDALVTSAVSQDKTFSSTSAVPAITLHNKVVYQGELNRVRITITNISVEVESGKPGLFTTTRNPSLTGASFSDHDTANSVASIDTSATAVASGTDPVIFLVASGNEKDKPTKIHINPGEAVTVSGAQATGGAATVTKIIITWEEDF